MVIRVDSLSIITTIEANIIHAECLASSTLTMTKKKKEPGHHRRVQLLR